MSEINTIACFSLFQSCCDFINRCFSMFHEKPSSNTFRRGLFILVRFSEQRDSSRTRTCGDIVCMLIYCMYQRYNGFIQRSFRTLILGFLKLSQALFLRFFLVSSRKRSKKKSYIPFLCVNRTLDFVDYFHHLFSFDLHFFLKILNLPHLVFDLSWPFLRCVLRLIL